MQDAQVMPAQVQVSQSKAQALEQNAPMAPILKARRELLKEQFITQDLLWAQ